MLQPPPAAHGDALAQDVLSGAGQELSRELIVERSLGVVPEVALVVDASALRLIDPSPLAQYCARLQILNLQSNMITKLPRARASRSHAARQASHPV